MFRQYLSDVQKEVGQHLQLSNLLKDKYEVLTAKLLDLEKELRDANERHVQEKLKLSAENEKLKERCEKLERDMELMKQTAKETCNSPAVNNFLSAVDLLILDDVEEPVKQRELKKVEEAENKYIVVQCDGSFCNYFAAANVEFVDYSAMNNLNGLTKDTKFYKKEMFILAKNSDLDDTSFTYLNLLRICKQWKNMCPVDGEIHVIRYEETGLLFSPMVDPKYLSNQMKKTGNIASLFTSDTSICYIGTSFRYDSKSKLRLDVILILVNNWNCYHDTLLSEESKAILETAP